MTARMLGLKLSDLILTSSQQTIRDGFYKLIIIIILQFD